MAKPKVVSEKKTKAGTVPREALLAKLERVRAAVDRHGLTGLEQAQHFIIRDDQVSAYNDRLSISMALGLRTGLELTVHAADLLKVLKDLTEEEVELTQGKDGNLTVATVSTRAGLAALPLEGELLELVDGLKLGSLKAKGWQALPPDFIEGLKLCGFSVSRDAADVAFSSVHVVGDGLGEAAVYSTDKRRISRYRFDGPLAADFLLPHGAADELCRYAVTQLQVVGSWAHFRDADGLTFSARTVSVDFPDCDSYFSLKGAKVTLPIDLVVALKQALVFAPGADPTHRHAEVTFRKGEVTVRSQNERGWLERTMPVSGLTPPAGVTKLLVNPVFFMDILQRTTVMIAAEGKAQFTAPRFDHVMVLPVSE